MSAICNLISEFTGDRNSGNVLFSKAHPKPVLKDPHLRFAPPRDLENRKSWVSHDKPGSTFTDPRTFDPSRFQFIVHVANDKHPEAINDPSADFRNRLLSCSIINQVKKSTYNFNNGFILKVPESNIYATTPCDMFLQNKVTEKDKRSSSNKSENLDRHLSYVNSKYGIRTPKDILACSHPRKINEIALLGKDVEVIGVFAKVLLKKTGEKTYPGISSKIFELQKKYAKRQGLPIIEIPINHLSPKEKKLKESKKQDVSAKKVFDKQKQKWVQETVATAEQASLKGRTHVGKKPVLGSKSR